MPVHSNNTPGYKKSKKQKKMEKLNKKQARRRKGIKIVGGKAEAKKPATKGEKTNLLKQMSMSREQPSKNEAAIQAGLLKMLTKKRKSGGVYVGGAMVHPGS